MAFQMIHMEIAYRLLKRIPPISNPAEFILGSVAPDSVHMNPDYDVNMKVKSHMFEGCGKWSDTQDYQLWKRNLQSFCEIVVRKGHVDKDFGIGICVHCLTDYWNDIKIWRKLQRRNIPPINTDEFKKAYYPEAQGIDIWLYQNSKNTKVIRKMLSEALAMDVEGIIHKEDVERQRNHLLNIQYDVDKVDISNYQYLLANDIHEFIEFTVNDIAETILEWLEECETNS